MLQMGMNGASEKRMGIHFQAKGDKKRARKAYAAACRKGSVFRGVFWGGFTGFFNERNFRERRMNHGEEETVCG
jgi:hypothetical protein